MNGFAGRDSRLSPSEKASGKPADTAAGGNGKKNGDGAPTDEVFQQVSENPLSCFLSFIWTHHRRAENLPEILGSSAGYDNVAATSEGLC